MKIEYFPSKEIVDEAMQINDPLLVLVYHDESKMIISNIDDAGEHLILLKLMGYKESDLDKCFRVVLNQEGADWTFVCPNDYKSIVNKEKRILAFYSDGIKSISKAIKEIGYDVELNIPKRYRRHFNMLNEG